MHKTLIMPLSSENRSVIEALTCPVHNKHPVIISEQGDSTKLTCCCAEFKVQCTYLLKKLLANDDSTNDQARNN